MTPSSDTPADQLLESRESALRELWSNSFSYTAAVIARSPLRPFPHRNALIKACLESINVFGDQAPIAPPPLHSQPQHLAEVDPMETIDGNALHEQQYNHHQQQQQQRDVSSEEPRETPQEPPLEPGSPRDDDSGGPRDGEELLQQQQQRN